jgi:hypothetical protein
MLHEYSAKHNDGKRYDPEPIHVDHTSGPSTHASVAKHYPPTSETDMIVEARTRSGQIRSLTGRPASQFFGGTSAYQFHAVEGLTSQLDDLPLHHQNHDSVDQMSTLPSFTYSPSATLFAFEYPPHDAVCRQLMATFFQRSYYYHMFIYREWFLRDWDAGAGPYYSDMLLYSMCALGARLSTDKDLYTKAPLFMEHAQSLLYASLDSPDLTTLQSLLVLGYLAIGQGQASKGWLFCGMAFRLTHEMGLHLDPSSWTSSDPNRGPVDREILRRVYWTAYVADKQLALHFGRPPALYPHEADVRNTIRIPYPPEWESLLDTYISPGTSATAYEDSIALVASLVHQIELSKILHEMVVDVFENRHQNGSVAVTNAQRVHVSLTKWLSRLPGRLHWNQWTVVPVPSFVLHLHMLFHTAMIILHRPPRHLLEQETQATFDEAHHTASLSRSDGVRICNSSLSNVMLLLNTYSRHGYRFADLPLDSVHILSTAASALLMKRFLDKLTWENAEFLRPMRTILAAMDDIRTTWPCIAEIRRNVENAMSHRETQKTGQAPFQAQDSELHGNGYAAQHLTKGPPAGRSEMDPFEFDLSMDLRMDLDVGLDLMSSASSRNVTSGGTGHYISAMQAKSAADTKNPNLDEYGFEKEGVNGEFGSTGGSGDVDDPLGLLLTDDFLAEEFQWDSLALP